jgi:hypothetical protein
MIRDFIRVVLWLALICTAAMFVVLALLLPSAGFVAGLIEFVTVLALSGAGIILWAWGDAEETERDLLKKLADEARIRAGVIRPGVLKDLADGISAALVPGSCPEFQHLLKRLAASRKIQP